MTATATAAMTTASRLQALTAAITTVGLRPAVATTAAAHPQVIGAHPAIAAHPAATAGQAIASKIT